MVFLAREFMFRGKTLQQLQQMEIHEFAKLLKARKRRSIERSAEKTIAKKVERVLKEKGGGKEPKLIRTHRRNTVVVPKFVGLKFAVHNGKEFAVIEVKPEMIGHFLGEFALTRKRVMHGKAGIGATKSSTAVQARG